MTILFYASHLRHFSLWRGLLEEGWQAHDPVRLTEANAEGNRAVEIARSGGASMAMQQEAEAVRAAHLGSRLSANTECARQIVPAERQECLALWEEVATVLSRAQMTK